MRAHVSELSVWHSSWRVSVLSDMCIHVLSGTCVYRVSVCRRAEWCVRVDVLSGVCVRV